MILDDLFEQRPLPAHIKPSDLPPGMRPRLTMKDVEKERPRGAFRYRVTPGKTGESPKDFLDLSGAEEYAKAVGGRVTPLEEQASDPDVQRGMMNLNSIEKQINNDQKVVLQNETGQPSYQIVLPVDKQWLITHAQEWIDAGRSMDLYRMMGTNAGFEFLLAAWQKEDLLRDKRARETRPEEPDLFGASQAGGPKSRRYQDESVHGQKKRTDIEEAPQGARGRTERMMSQMRARQPQATSDVEALAYELQDAERRDAQEIEKLEREVDNLEGDVKQELQKRIATLTKRKGGIQQAAATDTKIDATLDQLARVNDQQQRDIDDLTKALASIGQSRAASPTYGRAPAVAPAAAQAQPQVQRSPAPSRAAANEPAIPKTPTPTAKTDVSTVSATPTSTTAPTGSDLRSRFSIGAGDQEDLFQKAAESVGDELSMAKSALGTFGRALLNRRPASAAPALSGPVVATTPTGLTTARVGKVAKPPRTGGKVAGQVSQTPNAIRQRQRRAAAKTPAASAATAPAATVPATPAAPAPAAPPPAAAHDRYFKPTAAKPPVMTVGGRPVSAKDPAYAQIQAAMAKQAGTTPTVTEKKRPQPTNPDLWSRAKSAARSKFDVYPSAYANAWAAKWYKSKGGGWRMGKPKKK